MITERKMWGARWNCGPLYYINNIIILIKVLNINLKNYTSKIIFKIKFLSHDTLRNSKTPNAENSIGFNLT